MQTALFKAARNWGRIQGDSGGVRAPDPLHPERLVVALAAPRARASPWARTTPPRPPGTPTCGSRWSRRSPASPRGSGRSWCCATSRTSPRCRRRCPRHRVGHGQVDHPAGAGTAADAGARAGRADRGAGMTSRLRDELHRIGDAAPVADVAPDTWGRARRARTRDRVLAGAAVVAVLALVGGLAACCRRAIDAGGRRPRPALPSHLCRSRADRPAGRRLHSTSDVETDLAIGTQAVGYVTAPAVPVVVDAEDGATTCSTCRIRRHDGLPPATTGRPRAVAGRRPAGLPVRGPRLDAGTSRCPAASGSSTSRPATCASRRCAAAWCTLDSIAWSLRRQLGWCGRPAHDSLDAAARRRPVPRWPDASHRTSPARAVPASTLAMARRCSTPAQVQAAGPVTRATARRRLLDHGRRHGPAVRSGRRAGD